MPLPKIEDARNLSDGELADAILAAKRELFQLRLQQATRRLEKPHQFKHVRHRIGQLMTVERERQLAATQATTQPPQTDTQEE
ncbi:MAG TPA: 50S ribosomal protein L29 [Chroococcales cyanobacterium]|jgi:large subunit ribosomal protein L29